MAALPADGGTKDAFCDPYNTDGFPVGQVRDENDWCTAQNISGANQVCAMGMVKVGDDCKYGEYVFGDLPRGIN